MTWLRRYRPLIDWSDLAFEPTALPSTVNTPTASAYKVQVGMADSKLWLLMNEDEAPAIDIAEDPGCMKIVRDFSDVFSPLPPGLPPPRDVDHRIELQPDSIPPSRSTYRMSSAEL